MYPLLILLSLMVLLSATTPAFAQRCTTQWNAILGRYETRCDDGTRATEQYNPTLRQWERTITPPSPPGTPYYSPTIRCTRQYNAILRQWEEVCR